MVENYLKELMGDTNNLKLFASYSFDHFLVHRLLCVTKNLMSSPKKVWHFYKFTHELAFATS